MKFAYADPPYPGLAYHYPEQLEVDHAELIGRLEREYDGWALSTHVIGLRTVVPLLPDRARICAWVKTWASMKPGVTLTWAWEPIVVAPVRPPPRSMHDWVSARAAMGRGLFGAKPEQVAHFIFAAAGLESDDEVVDLYPGTGMLGREWERWRRQPPLRLGVAPRLRRKMNLELPTS